MKTQTSTMLKTTATLIWFQLLLGSCDARRRVPVTGFISPSQALYVSRKEKAFEHRLADGRPSPTSDFSNFLSSINNHEPQRSSRIKVLLSSSSPQTPFDNDDDASQGPSEESRRKRIRTRIAKLARNVMSKPLASAAPMPAAIAALLKDATINAVDMAVDEARRFSALHASTTDVTELVNDAFSPMESSLLEMERSLERAKLAFKDAKTQATHAIEAVQAAAIAQAKEAAEAVAAAEKTAEQKVMANIYSDADVETLRFEDVSYDDSDMAPPFLDEYQCLVPGEPIVRVEKAPENSRRIFAGIDILASVDDVWGILTNYSNLQNVVPNLVVNEVVELYDGQKPGRAVTIEKLAPDEVQCEQMAKQMKGALLKQVGGTRVVGIQFSAKTTLEVREWPQGLPDFAHFNDEIYQGKQRDARAKEYSKIELRRYRFPRPFAVSSLPTRDISMQSIENDDGEFRLYQGVWRMQPLPGCAPPGMQAMRLTYAVCVSPRAYLPVQLVEGNIVRDLCSNLVAIRKYVAARVPV